MASWNVHIDGEVGKPEVDMLTVMSEEQPPQIRLEIRVPGIRASGAEQKQLARQAIQAALTALQQALDSPKDLPSLPR